MQYTLGKLVNQQHSRTTSQITKVTPFFAPEAPYQTQFIPRISTHPLVPRET